LFPLDGVSILSIAANLLIEPVWQIPGSGIALRRDGSCGYFIDVAVHINSSLNMAENSESPGVVPRGFHGYSMYSVWVSDQKDCSLCKVHSCTVTVEGVADLRRAPHSV